LGVLYDAGGSGLRAREGVGEADTWYTHSMTM
jgi:hypothetical protein